MLALGATYQVGKPQLIKKAHTSIQRKTRSGWRRGRARPVPSILLDAFLASWLSSAVGNRCDRSTPCSLFIQKLKPKSKYALLLSVVVWQPVRWFPTLALVLCWYYWAVEHFLCSFEQILFKFSTVLSLLWTKFTSSPVFWCPCKCCFVKLISTAFQLSN